MEHLLRRPLILTADNFTPASRTPWGGRRIVELYKSEVPGAGSHESEQVGESWEISVEPDFPSEVEGTGLRLSDVLAMDPRAALGRESALGRTATALLVKLLDAKDELSVQIHPSDDYVGLESDQAGKPESWYVLEREAGCGLYLGLEEGVSREQMAEGLATGADVSKMLCFVPVDPGDFFLIEAGTAHAIGRGVTLVEPQHVAPGKRGVTYRYWDWNRRYDEGGRLDPKGRGRPLHVDDALSVTAWDAPRGAALLDHIRLRTGAARVNGDARLEPLCSPSGPITSTHLAVERLMGNGELRLPEVGVLRGLTVVGGSVELVGPGYEMRVDRGRSAVLPACLEGVTARLENAHALVCCIAVP